MIDLAIGGIIRLTVEIDRLPKGVNVLFIWEVREELKEYLRNALRDLEEVQLIFPQHAKEEEYLAYAEEANIIVGWRPTMEVLNKSSSLELFINPGAGVQHLLGIFKDLNTRRKVVLVNGHGNSYFTAQHAVALLLCLANKVILHHNWMVDGQWRKGDDDGKSIPLRKRKIGLLGYGAVNTKVHRFLSGFDVEFHILKKSWQNQHEEMNVAAKYEPHQLYEFLANIDILVNATPHTSETEGMIGKRELEILGPEGLLVNIGRGSTIDEESLYNALLNGTIKGAALDVWYNYQPISNEDGKKWPYSYPFHELTNVVLSPHRGASPMDDLERWNEVIDNIRAYFSGSREFNNQVDLERGY
ncbi:MAG: NAD(P)-dependent oxidoreductase [Candidatus Thorarchaeota archaeon]